MSLHEVYFLSDLFFRSHSLQSHFANEHENLEAYIEDRVGCRKL